MLATPLLTSKSFAIDGRSRLPTNTVVVAAYVGAIARVAKAPAAAPANTIAIATAASFVLGERPIRSIIRRSPTRRSRGRDTAASPPRRHGTTPGALVRARPGAAPGRPSALRSGDLVSIDA